MEDVRLRFSKRPRLAKYAWMICSIICSAPYFYIISINGLNLNREWFAQLRLSWRRWWFRIGSRRFINIASGRGGKWWCFTYHMINKRLFYSPMTRLILVVERNWRSFLEHRSKIPRASNNIPLRDYSRAVISMFRWNACHHWNRCFPANGAEQIVQMSSNLAHHLNYVYYLTCGCRYVPLWANFQLSQDMRLDVPI